MARLAANVCHFVILLIHDERRVLEGYVCSQMD